MTIVIDTSVLIDHLRGHPGAKARLGDAVEAGERLVGSVLTRTEILAGARDEERAQTDALLAILDWIPVDVALADRAGVLAQRHLRTHPGVDTVDYVIAATADAVHGKLWTRNVSHFPMLPGLTPPY